MTESRTLAEQLKAWALSQPSAPALVDPEGESGGRTLSWGEYWVEVKAIGKGLMAAGVAPGDCVAIVGVNRAEWVLCQMAMMAIRVVPAPLYTTSTAEQFAYIIGHSKSRWVFCDDAGQRDKLIRCRDELGCDLQEIITWREEDGAGPGITSLADLKKAGAAVGDDIFDQRMADVDSDATALLIYTSGTTGIPKGVQLTHQGLLAIGHQIEGMYPQLMEESFYRVVSYLPLCHVAEQVFTNIGAMKSGGVVYFCADISTVRDVLTVARPTVFLGVPRVWEKMEVALRSRFAEATGVRARLLRWALKTEKTCFEQSQKTGRPVEPFARKLAHRIVLSKIHDGLGFDKLIVAGSGAAPIGLETLSFFASMGILIHEGYGMSETTGIATMPPLNRPRFGTVGQPIEGVELAIAEDGEILLRGETMTPGYLHMPEETAALIDGDGWLHTGDLGSVDAEGFVSITGRKKDILITAGGKNVAPAEMEGHIQGIPGVGHAIVVGDRQPYLSALIAIDPEALDALSTAAGIPLSSVEQALKTPAIEVFIESRIESDCNRKVARYQTIKKFKLLPEPLSEERGELTPTMKVKRNVVSERYAPLIEEMYRS
jgi:long-subunit acyl-CoA synthetase (AMP-forming)